MGGIENPTTWLSLRHPAHERTHDRSRRRFDPARSNLAWMHALPYCCG